MIYDASFWREHEDVARAVDGREREAQLCDVEWRRGAIVGGFIVTDAAWNEETSEQPEVRRSNSNPGRLLCLAGFSQ